MKKTLIQLANEIIDKDNNINTALENTSDTNDIIALSKQKASISDVVNLSKNYVNLCEEIDNIKSIINEEKDEEFLSLAKEELNQLNSSLSTQEEELKIAMLPKNPEDSKNAIIEIRAGTGGDEAALFAADLFKMYQKFAEKKRWKLEIVHISHGDLHGIKEVSFEVYGKDVFGLLKFESGTHRVQRVPATENAGRLHTSAVTVAVFPEISDIDITINQNDLKIDVFRSSGAGGQHVNKTESAVRITHIPSGIVVVQQEDRSQIKNREKAMKILRSKIYQFEFNKREEEMASNRRSQIGSGDRSEKIRTYNFQQNRLTDHRINFSLYNLEEIIHEGIIDEVVEALRLDSQNKLLENSSC